MAPKPGDPAYDHQKQVLLGPNRLQLMVTEASETLGDSNFLDYIRMKTCSDVFVQEILDHIIPNRVSSPQSKLSRMDYAKFRWHDGLLFRNNQMYIPDDATSRLQVLQYCHDSPLAGHFGVQKTLELVTRNYWWPQLRQFITDYVRSCDVCCRSKVPRHRPYGLLQPLPIPPGPWKSISLDFITDLPPSKGFDAILTVVDRFTKMAHFLPCMKAFTSQDTASLVMREVFKHHGLPDDIISDRGPQFISKFWTHLLEILRISCNLSSSYHPQTDGQTERTNQTLEQYLRCFINYQQDDWVDFLHMAEFAYNNSIHSSTGYTPFFANTGYHPRSMMLEHQKVSNSPAVEDRIAQLKEIQSKLSTHLLQAQTAYKRAADRHRMDPSKKPIFRLGDKVWLLRRNVKTTRPCEKLDFQRLGPFVISGQVNDVAFRLDLPSHMHLHPVFHVSLLEPFTSSSIPNRVVPPPPPVQLLDGPEYEVEAILDSKVIRNKLHYLVDWSGYSPNDRTWEPAENLNNAKETIIDFHRRYPDKPNQNSCIATRGTRRQRRG